MLNPKPEPNEYKRLILLIIITSSIGLIMMLFTWLLLSPNQGVTTKLPTSGNTNVNVVPIPTPIPEKEEKIILDLSALSIKKAEAKRKKKLTKKFEETEDKTRETDTLKKTKREENITSKGEIRERRTAPENSDSGASEYQQEPPYEYRQEPKVNRGNFSPPELPRRRNTQIDSEFVPGPTLKKLEPIPAPQLETIPEPNKKQEDKEYEKIPESEREQVPRIGPIPEQESNPTNGNTQGNSPWIIKQREESDRQ